MLNAVEYIIDQQEEEDLPRLFPKAEDVEAELEIYVAMQLMISMLMMNHLLIQMLPTISIMI
jgi:hypothetical protein